VSESTRDPVRRLRRQLGLPVTGVRQVDQGAGKPLLWAVELEDGRVVVLGDATHIRAGSSSRVVIDAGGKWLSTAAGWRVVAWLRRAHNERIAAGEVRP
jgi:hypothetical protein